MVEVVSADASERAELRDPGLAAFLAWLIPGLGHWYQGRVAKACLFFVLIMGTFAYGLYLGGDAKVGWGRVVYFAWREDDHRWHFFCQMGIGLPVLPAVLQASPLHDVTEKVIGRFMAPPRPSGFNAPPEEPATHLQDPTDSTLQKHLNRAFELGQVYTMIAGLLNILVIYDAWGGPFWNEPRKEEETDEKEDKSEVPSHD